MTFSQKLLKKTKVTSIIMPIIPNLNSLQIRSLKGMQISKIWNSHLFLFKCLLTKSSKLTKTTTISNTMIYLTWLILKVIKIMTRVVLLTPSKILANKTLILRVINLKTNSSWWVKKTWMVKRMKAFTSRTTLSCEEYR